MADEPQLVAVGERVALGPIRKDLLDRYLRWVNDLEVRHGLANLGLYTPESEETWYAEASAAMGKREPEQVHFTIYDRSDGAPVGTTGLFQLEWRLSRGRFGILLGERRGAGLGTEATSSRSRCSTARATSWRASRSTRTTARAEDARCRCAAA